MLGISDVTQIWRITIPLIFLAKKCCASWTTLDQAGGNLDEYYDLLHSVHSSPNGYYNPKQVVRHEDPDDTTSLRGVFAVERIEQGEVLSRVPWDNLLVPSYVSRLSIWRPDDAEVPDCDAVRTLAQEMRLGNQSKHAFFMEFLNAQTDSVLPSVWSSQGKALLSDIIGASQQVDENIPPHEPFSWMDDTDWFENCNIDPNDQLVVKAMFLIVIYADDDVMIPAYCFYNHRNGNWTNADAEIRFFKHHETVATRTIEVGEQIHISYNLCGECHGRKTLYGTSDIFRDYGFLELMPQRWYYNFDELQFDLDQNKKGELEVSWDEQLRPAGQHDRDKTIVYFERQIRRLRRMRNIYWSDRKHTIPRYEWETSWAFQRANIVAMTAALQSLQDNSTQEHTCLALNQAEQEQEQDQDDFKVDQLEHRYDTLDFEVDDLDYDQSSWGIAARENFISGQYTEVDSTGKYNLYPVHKFVQKNKLGDVCLYEDKNKMIQVCSSFRPYHYEYFVHAAARFIETVRRVLIVGGGNAMMLHEVLKYPDLEQVVLLELNQQIVRKSFQHFRTQPHFDDDRVDWWFGDVSKSIFMLLQDEHSLGLFDLILVEHAENRSEVFENMSQLLAPGGIMATNDLHFDLFSGIFQYTTQLFYECPVVYHQILVMGSNQIDFLHDTVGDHQIDALLYEPLIKAGKRFQFLHDYRRNEDFWTKADPQDNVETETIKPLQPISRLEIIEIIEAENTSVNVSFSLLDSIRPQIQKLGLTPLQAHVLDSEAVVIPMKEGYILSRRWPELKYCAFEVHLWEAFQKAHSLRNVLAQAVGSTLVSSYRIISGRMHDTSVGVANDRNQQIKQTKTTENDWKAQASSREDPLVYDKIMRIAIHEIVKLIDDSERLTSVVICGSTEKCLGADILANMKGNNNIFRLSSCPGLMEKDADKSIWYSRMYDCERDMISQLEEALESTSSSMLDIFLVDESAPYPILQIWNSILSSDKFHGRWIREPNLFVAWSTIPGKERWRRNFLDRYRKQCEHDPLARAEFVLQTDGSIIEIGIVLGGADSVVQNLSTLQFWILERLKQGGIVVHVDLPTIRGGLFAVDQEEPTRSTLSDYDRSPAQEQFAKQRSLGRQVIHQLEPTRSEIVAVSTDRLDDAMKQALDFVGLEVTSHHQVTDLGDRVMIAYGWLHGNAILICDVGQEHIDIILFSYNEAPQLPGFFLTKLLRVLEDKFEAIARDDQPRGIGRVVNFKADLKTRRDRPQS